MILFLGDSISVGAGASRRDNAYTHRVAAALGERYANWSAGGRTSLDGVAVAEQAILQTLPDLTVIAFGVNDRKPVPSRYRRLRRGRPVAIAPAAFAKNIADMIWLAESRCGSRVIVVAPPPIPPGLPGYIESLYRLGAPIAEAVWGDGMDDGAHPNDGGHAALADAVLQVAHQSAPALVVDPLRAVP